MLVHDTVDSVQVGWGGGGGGGGGGGQAHFINLSYLCCHLMAPLPTGGPSSHTAVGLEDRSWGTKFGFGFELK